MGTSYKWRKNGKINEQIPGWEQTRNIIPKSTHLNYLNFADDSNIGIVDINDILQILGSYTYSTEVIFLLIGKINVTIQIY